MPSTAQTDSAIGWILAALLALHLAFTFSAAPARAEAAGGDFSGWELRVAALDPVSIGVAPRRKPVDASGGPDVFGSVAVSMSRLAISERWRALLAENAARYFRSGCDAGKPPCAAAGWAGWTKVHAEASAMPPGERIAYVNAKVNALVRYTPDAGLYGRGDHWALLAETVELGAGDCEDIAIAKMWMLNALGVPLGDMKVTVLKDRRRGLDHAVLAIRGGGRMLILDNVHDQVLEDAAIGHYRPIFSVSAAGSWVHGFRAAPERLSAVEGLRPGLGR